MIKSKILLPFISVAFLVSCGTGGGGDQPKKEYFTVKFFDANDKVIQTIENVESGSTIEFTGDEPTKESSEPTKKYRFANWDKDITKPIIAYTEFKPVFDEINLFEVTFYLDDGKTILKGGNEHPYYVEENTIPIPPSDPHKDPTEGTTYSFAGWEPSLSEIAGPTNYTAKFDTILDSEEVTFSVPADAISYVSTTQSVLYNELASKPTIDPYRHGYLFKGWYEDDDCTVPFDFGTKHIKGATTIYSDWEEDNRFKTPLCFTSVVDNNTILKHEGYYYKTSLDDPWTLGDGSTTITLNQGDYVYVGSDDAYDDAEVNCSRPNDKFIASGNMMSLINHNDFQNLFEMTRDWQFAKYFCWSKITDASELLLPATTLTYACYYNLFQQCTSLTAAPSLPAKILQNKCYGSMFVYSAITSLFISATTYASRCCEFAINNCSSLTEVKVNFGTPDSQEWSVGTDATYYWAESVSTTPTFKWHGSAKGPSKRNVNTAPKAWPVETY